MKLSRMCEQAVVRMPAVQNKSLIPSGTPSSDAALAFCQSPIRGSRHITSAVWRFQHERIERARFLDGGDVRVGKFSRGKFLLAQGVTRLRQRQRRKLAHPAGSSEEKLLFSAGLLAGSAFFSSSAAG